MKSLKLRVVHSRHLQTANEDHYANLLQTSKGLCVITDCSFQAAQNDFFP